jgi:hypothetical protein
LCPAHNTLLAEHDYGREVMARYRGGARGPRPPGATNIPSRPA